MLKIDEMEGDENWKAAIEPISSVASISYYSLEEAIHN